MKKTRSKIIFQKEPNLLENILEHVQRTSFSEYPVLCPNLVAKLLQLSSEKMTGKEVKIEKKLKVASLALFLNMHALIN